MPRHHLVPRMVLRRFADDRGRLVMVDRDAPNRAVPAVVARAGAETGFYRVETNDVEDGDRDGHDPELVEKALAGLEDVVAPLLAGLIEDASRRQRSGTASRCSSRCS